MYVMYTHKSGDEKKTYSVKTNIDDWKEIVVATDIKVTDGKMYSRTIFGRSRK